MLCTCFCWSRGVSSHECLVLGGCRRKIISSTFCSLKSQDNERNLELRAKNEQIQELKAMITRLTANNNDMLALLTQKVGLEDSLKVAKSANQELLKKLTEETKKTINLSTKLSSAEQEIQRLRIVVK